MICKACNEVELERPQSVTRGICLECALIHGGLVAGELPHDRLIVEDIYGGPCRCGRGFLARHDSGLCEWCTAEPTFCQCRNCRAGKFWSPDDWLPPPAKGSRATYIERSSFTTDIEEEESSEQ